jgi:caa(3)-type oxidase subunit IV
VDIPFSNPLPVMSESGPLSLFDPKTRYIIIGASLLVLTGITVWTSFFSVTVGVSIFLALLIATIKGSLVASFFMHLIIEKKLILIILLVTAAFFFALIFQPFSDTINNVGNPNVY